MPYALNVVANGSLLYFAIVHCGAITFHKRNVIPGNAVFGNRCGIFFFQIIINISVGLQRHEYVKRNK